MTPDGIQQYDKHGRPVCKICGLAYDRLLAHVRQKHHIPSEEYRARFGFCKSFAFISQRSREKVREKTLSHPDLIRRNLIEHGKATRARPGEKRFKHIITPQRLRIIASNKAKRVIKPKRHAFCLVCNKRLSSPAGKLCLKHYRLAMAERNKKRRAIK